jgi:6-phosphogluconolactonase
MKREIQIFRDSDALAQALAIHVLQMAAEAVKARGCFWLAIPGGSVVSVLAQGLATARVDASAWDCFWTDERCVPSDDPQSNFRLARHELFARLHIPRDRIHPMAGTLDPDAAARAYEADLARVLGIVAGELPRFDLVLLGLGEDGHVASLFPGNPALAETKRWVAPVRNSPKPPPERITLTLPVINQARHMLVVATGAGKADALARTLAPGAEQPELPAQQLRPSDGDLRWLLDLAAAAKWKAPP